jgi:anti-anti-sigma factor
MARAPRSRPRGDSGAPWVIEQGRVTMQLEDEGDSTFLSLFGELDLSNAEVLDSMLRSIEAGPAEAIVVDLSALEFIDSTGVVVLARAASRSRDASKRLVLLRPPEDVDRVFQLTGLSEHLPFAD